MNPYLLLSMMGGRRGLSRRKLLLLAATGALGAGLTLDAGDGQMDITKMMLFGLI